MRQRNERAYRRDAERLQREQEDYNRKQKLQQEDEELRHDGNF
jgi:hypothetical protein